MKIVQNNLMGIQSSLFNGADFVDGNNEMFFDPDEYSGVQAIHIRFLGGWANSSSVGQIRFYDKTNNQVLATFDVSAAFPTLYESSDIKNLLMTPGIKQIIVQGKRTSGSGYIESVVETLSVEQNDTTASRKTAYFEIILDAGIGGFYGSWTSFSVCQQVIPIDHCDGTVKVYLEAFIRTTSGGIAKARLYDITAGAEVSGSLVTTTEITNTRILSGELTIDPTHYYRAEISNGVSGKDTFGKYVALRVKVQGFNKTAALIRNMYWGQPIASGTFEDAQGGMPFDPSKISGPDGLSYAFREGVYMGKFVNYPINYRMYNHTAGALITGSDFQITSGTPSTQFFNKTPTMPASYCIFDWQADRGDSYTAINAVLFAYQQENLPSTPSLPADPTQPSGYHCFMSQFFKNMLAGRTPLKTPDGVNKCW
jgi:hypothetical protein